MKNMKSERKKGFTKAKLHNRFKESGRHHIKTAAFTLIELIVVMAVIGILVLLAAPKFLGYTERARETKHIHTAKVIETALEAYLINGGAFPDDLEVVDKTLLEEAANKETLIGVGGYVTSVDEEVYYELTYDFIKKLDVKLSAKNALLIQANASSISTAVYASEKGIALVDKEKTMKGYVSQSGDSVNHPETDDESSNPNPDGDDESTVPEEVPEKVWVPELNKISAGNNHSLALKDDGTVWAWGENEYGQLGNGTESDKTNPVKVNNLTNIISIDAGYDYSLALKDDGTVWTWGKDEYGRRGAATSSWFFNTPVQVVGLSDIVSISAGQSFSLALKNDGTVWGWGENSSGQLGSIGSIVYKARQLSSLEEIEAISAGAYHSIFLKKDKTVWSVGNNSFGQLGNGKRTTSSIPVQAQGLTEISSIDAGEKFSLALKSDGTVWSWGNNSNGQLGDGTNTDRDTPIQVNSLTGIRSITAGANHSLAIDTNGLFWSWGLNLYAQLGTGNSVDRVVPTQKQPISGLVSISAGGKHSLTLKDDGSIWAWGEGQCGRLGNGSEISKAYPTQVKNSNGTFFLIK